MDPDALRLFERFVDEEERGVSGFYDVDEFVSLVETCIIFGNMDKARRILRKARLQYPEAVDLKLKEAELCLETDRFEKALLLLEEIERIEPYLSEIYILRGHVLKCLKKCREAREAFLKARQTGADELDVDIGLAETEIAAGNSVKAWEYMQRIIGFEDDTVETCNRFLDMAQTGGLLSQAIGFVRNLLKKDPYSIRYWRLLSELYEMQEEYGASLEADNFILAIEPDEEEALLHKFCLIPRLRSASREKLPEFYARIERLAQKSEDRELLTCVWHRLAQFYEQEDWGAAEMYYRRLLDFSEYRQFVFFRLGVLETFMQRYEQALKLFFEALRCDEEPYTMLESPARIYRGIACACFAVGDAEEGLKYNLLAVETEPEHPDHLYAYVLNACHTGNAGKSGAYLTKALQKGIDAPLLFAQACLAFCTDQKETAYGLFLRAFTLDSSLIAKADLLPELLQDCEFQKIQAVFPVQEKNDSVNPENPFTYYGPEPWMHTA